MKICFLDLESFFNELKVDNIGGIYVYVAISCRFGGKLGEIFVG